MKRGNFILLTGLGITAIAIPTWYFANQEDHNSFFEEPELLSHIWDGNKIREIGEQYRRQVSEENDEQELVALLMTDAETELQTLEALRQQIKGDYVSGNTVMLDGWILSKTEARQCALFSLTN